MIDRVLVSASSGYSIMGVNSTFQGSRHFSFAIRNIFFVTELFKIRILSRAQAALGRLIWN